VKHPGAHEAPVGSLRPTIEMADIVNRFGGQLISTRVLNAQQRRALSAISVCRTARLGGHVDVCNHCDTQRPSYNSCRDRHCPKCQWLASQRWLDRRLQKILPVHHFHVVFTLPSQLRSLTMYNRELIFALLFESASLTLKKLAADDRHLGASLGVTAVLHTWSRDLTFHPHLHCVVTGGGLAEDGSWVRTRAGFLFPVRVLGKLFRGVFLDRLKGYAAAGKLDFGGKCAELEDPDGFQAFVDKLYSKRWNVYCKKPFGGVEAVHGYLGRYTHRIAIGNRRLISIDDSKVTFYTRNGQTASLPPVSFLSRFVNHVLPKNFVRIRHFGLYASSNVNTKLANARSLLTDDEVLHVDKSKPDARVAKPAPSDEPDFAKRFRIATGVDLSRCSVCGSEVTRHGLAKAGVGVGAGSCRAPPRAA